MGRVKTIARRSFLIGSAAVAGGVAFGVHRAFKDLGNPNLANLKEGAASFNPWVVIDDQNIHPRQSRFELLFPAGLPLPHSNSLVIEGGVGAGGEGDGAGFRCQ